jgi:exodeoxyribonuclease V alpha subunit
VLCYTHAYPEGTARLNEAFHRRVADDSGLERPPDFCPGEPVVMLANDYERGVFNGDTGVVLRVRSDGSAHFMLVFRRASGYVAFYPSSLREQVRHAFALTVHKAQGSEHDHVLLVLPAEDFPMNTRELIYTALTRARTSVTIAGAPERLASGVARPVRRDTGVPARLARALLQAPVAGH